MNMTIPKNKLLRKFVVYLVGGVVVIGGVVYLIIQDPLELGGSPELLNRQAQQLPEDVAAPTQEALSADSILDCKEEFGCLVRASMGCRPSKVVNTATLEILGIKQISTSFFEIKGSEADKCNFYLRTEKLDLIFPPNIPQEIVNREKEIQKDLEGRDGICKFDTSDLTVLLTRWERGIFSVEDFNTAECRGIYFKRPS